MKNQLFTEKPVRCVILMSGSGTNTEALLNFERSLANPAYSVAALVTDAPETSRTRELAARYGLPLVEHDLKAFYRANGEESVKLDTPRRRELREEWSQGLWEKIKAFDPGFACFAGFTALSNIARELPCLNVHPGDLTRCAPEGSRAYAGLHVLPVEKAILSGEKALRSSVIWVQPYSGNGSKEMDGGPILGISAPLPVELGEHSLQELEECRRQRVPGVKCTDALRQLALEHIERLKVHGDHQVFPRAVADFAANCFRCEGEELYYNNEKVVTVEYSASAPPQKITL